MDVIVREANVQDAKKIAEIHSSSWRSTYKGIVPQCYLDRMLENFDDRTERWKKSLSLKENDFCLVAEIDDKTVGFCQGGKSRDSEYDVELYAIYILDEHHGKGVGKRLMKKFMDNFIKDEDKNMIVWVLEENSAKKFYEKMGGFFVKKKEISIEGAKLTELGYSWSLNK